MGPIEELAHEDMAANSDKYAPRESGFFRELRERKADRLSVKPIDPEVAALIGLTTEAAGTYMMLHRGTGTEGNPVYAKLFRHDPLKTASVSRLAGSG